MHWIEETRRLKVSFSYDASSASPHPLDMTTEAMEGKLMRQVVTRGYISLPNAEQKHLTMYIPNSASMRAQVRPTVEAAVKYVFQRTATALDGALEALDDKQRYALCIDQCRKVMMTLLQKLARNEISHMEYRLVGLQTALPQLVFKYGFILSDILLTRAGISTEAQAFLSSPEVKQNWSALQNLVIQGSRLCDVKEKAFQDRVNNLNPAQKEAFQKQLNTMRPNSAAPADSKTAATPATEVLDATPDSNTKKKKKKKTKKTKKKTTTAQVSKEGESSSYTSWLVGGALALAGLGAAYYFLSSSSKSSSQAPKPRRRLR
jgi:hypothetical protein